MLTLQYLLLNFCTPNHTFFQTFHKNPDWDARVPHKCHGLEDRCCSLEVADEWNIACWNAKRMCSVKLTFSHYKLHALLAALNAWLQRDACLCVSMACLCFLRGRQFTATLYSYYVLECKTKYYSLVMSLADFTHPSGPPSGPPSLLSNGYRVFPGGKAAGSWRWPPTPSSAEVKERIDLYL